MDTGITFVAATGAAGLLADWASSFLETILAGFASAAVFFETGLVGAAVTLVAIAGFLATIGFFATACFVIGFLAVTLATAFLTAACLITTFLVAVFLATGFVTAGFAATPAFFTACLTGVFLASPLPEDLGVEAGFDLPAVFATDGFATAFATASLPTFVAGGLPADPADERANGLVTAFTALFFATVAFTLVAAAPRTLGGALPLLTLEAVEACVVFAIFLTVFGRGGREL